MRGVVVNISEIAVGDFFSCFNADEKENFFIRIPDGSDSGTYGSGYPIFKAYCLNEERESISEVYAGFLRDRIIQVKPYKKNEMYVLCNVIKLDKTEILDYLKD